MAVQRGSRGWRLDGWTPTSVVTVMIEPATPGPYVCLGRLGEA